MPSEIAKSAVNISLSLIEADLSKCRSEEVVLRFQVILTTDSADAGTTEVIRIAPERVSIPAASEEIVSIILTASAPEGLIGPFVLRGVLEGKDSNETLTLSVKGEVVGGQFWIAASKGAAQLGEEPLQVVIARCHIAGSRTEILEIVNDGDSVSKAYVKLEGSGTEFKITPSLSPSEAQNSNYYYENGRWNFEVKAHSRVGFAVVFEPVTQVRFGNQWVQAYAIHILLY